MSAWPIVKATILTYYILTRATLQLNQLLHNIIGKFLMNLYFLILKTGIGPLIPVMKLGVGHLRVRVPLTSGTLLMLLKLQEIIMK